MTACALAVAARKMHTAITSIPRSTRNHTFFVSIIRLSSFCLAFRQCDWNSLTNQYLARWRLAERHQITTLKQFTTQ
jgi:hypothetical protein